MYDPIITLNQAVLSTYTPEQKAELYKSCPTEVFETDESYEQVGGSCSKTVAGRGY